MKKFLVAAAMALVPASALAFQAPAATAPAAPAAPTGAAAAVAAAATTDADPALWVVRDDDTKIYLFGTFHLLDGRPWLNDEVKTAFDSADELVVEAIIPENPAELQPLVLRYAVDPQGRRLSQRLTAEQNEALGEAVATLGAPASAFDPLEPWFVSMSLAAVASQKLGISAANGPEKVLISAARTRGIPVSELEGIEWQLQLFDNMPESQQIAQLRQALDNLEAMSEQLAPMLTAWSTGDVEGLVRIINASGEQDPDLHRILFTNRNATWAGWIEERLKRPGTVFLAVGAGHLAGTDSVQAALQARGLSAIRVPHQEAAPAAP